MFVVHCSDDLQCHFKVIKLEYIKGCYCVGSAEALFVICKMTLYSILYSLLQTDLSIMNIQKASKKIQKAFKRSIQNHLHVFQQLNLLGALSTDNNNKIWLFLLLYIIY